MNPMYTARPIANDNEPAMILPFPAMPRLDEVLPKQELTDDEIAALEVG